MGILVLILLCMGYGAYTFVKSGALASLATRFEESSENERNGFQNFIISCYDPFKKIEDENIQSRDDFVEDLKKDERNMFTDDIVQFVQDLDIKEFKKFKELILKFDGNTLKAFRCYKSILNSRKVASFAPVLIVLGLLFNISGILFVGVFLSIGASSFYFLMRLTKGNKILSIVLGIIAGMIIGSIIYNLLLTAFIYGGY